MPRNTFMPYFWLSMNPWPFSGSHECPRRTSCPAWRMAFMTASSAPACAGQHIWLAERRRSPLAIRITGSGISHIVTYPLNFNDIHELAAASPDPTHLQNSIAPESGARLDSGGLRGRQPRRQHRDRPNGQSRNGERERVVRLNSKQQTL